MGVLVIGLGGTIAMTGAVGGGVAPALSAQQLLDAVPGLADTGIDVEARTFRALPGASLSFDDLVELVGVIEASGTGVVVVQGTDTIEESAYVLDLLYAGPHPLVVTGAMRNPTQAGADGPANLLAAVVVAAGPATRDLGCLVVFGDEIHAARRVRKTHSTSTATFVSPNGGPLGYVIEGRAHIVNRLVGRHAFPRPKRAPKRVPERVPELERELERELKRAPERAPLVAVLPATLGDDGVLLEALVSRLDGLVVAGFGAGHVPAGWVEPLTEAAGRIPVILSSRTGSGPVLSGTYGFPGSERDLLSRGLISAGLLDPYKARILLRLALAADVDHEQIEAAFAVAGGLDPEAVWPWPVGN